MLISMKRRGLKEILMLMVNFNGWENSLGMTLAAALIKISFVFNHSEKEIAKMTIP